MNHPVVASILVLTEDSAPRAESVVRKLVEKLLRYLESRCDPQRIRFEPIDPETRPLMSANQWAGSDQKRYIVRTRLHRIIAAKLVDPTGFVFQHIDADRRWTDRERDPSTNVAHLGRLLTHVRRELTDRFQPAKTRPPRRARKAIDTMSAAEIDASVQRCLARFIPLVPYWEIEAWLYQNIRRAAELCPGPPRCTRQPSCHSKLAEWQDDRGALDEVEDPSEALCLGKQHNEELVQSLPIKLVVDAGKSLATVVSAIYDCDDLLDAIRRTHTDEPTPCSPT